MTTTTFLTEKVQTLLEPDEDLMLERKGRDRRALRRELAPTTTMGRGERYVEEGDGGIPANIIVGDAYGLTSGEYADDGWDYAVWQHDTASLWNRVDNNSGAVQKSLWLDLESDSANVGSSVVNDAVTIPQQTGIRTAPDQPDTLRMPYTFPNDTMYLVPQHDGDFFQMYEQDGPTMIDEPIRKNGGKIEYEYYWRAGQAFGFGSHRNDDGSGDGEALDAVKITNVSTLFN